MFSALLDGDVRVIDIAWLERHGLATYAAAAGARHSRLRKAVATQLVHSHSIDEVLSALRGIPVIGFKGLDYAHRLYPDAALRPMGDHDLLVRDADFPEALRRLNAIGYRDALVQRGVAAHPQHYAAQLVRGAHHVDLHRAIRQSVRAAVPYDEVFARATSGKGIAWLEPIDRLLVHCMHLAGHECLAPLIHYLDLELLLRETPLSDAVVERASSWRVLHSLLGVLFVRARLRGWHMSAFPGAELLPSANEVSSLRRPPRALQLVRKALLMDGARERLRFAAYALLRSPPRPYRS